MNKNKKGTHRTDEHSSSADGKNEIVDGDRSTEIVPYPWSRVHAARISEQKLHGNESAQANEHVPHYATPNAISDGTVQPFLIVHWWYIDIFVYFSHKFVSQS